MGRSSRLGLATLVAGGLAGVALLALGRRPAVERTEHRVVEVSAARHPLVIQLAPAGGEAQPARDAVAGPPEADPASEEEGSAPPATGVRLGLFDASTGAPLAGARVETFDDSVPGVRHADASGLVVLPFEPAERPPPDPLGRGRPSGARFRVEVTADGHERFAGQLERLPEIGLSLGPIVPLGGRVLAADTGRPVAGARVGYEQASAVTDARGRFALEGPAKAPALVTAEAEGFLRSRESLDLRGLDGGGALELRLERGIVLEGLVFAAESGVPLAGVRVATGTDVAEDVSTDAAGRFALRLAPGQDGSVRLSFSADERCTQTASWGADALSAPLEVGLVRGVTVSGRVLDEDGQPLAGARVGWSGPGSSTFGPLVPPSARLRPTWGEGDATTGEDGAFRLERIVPGAEGRLVALAHGYGTWLGRYAGFPPGHEERVEIRLEREARGALEGRITWGGRPVTGKVGVRTASGERWTTLRQATEYSLRDLEAGRVTLFASVSLDAHGDPRFGATVEEVVEVPEEGSVTHDLELDRPVGTLAGFVLRAGGEPAEGVDLVAEGASGGVFTAATRAGGAFELVVPAEPSTYALAADGHVFEGLRTGRRDLRLVLPAAPATGTLRFRARDPEGALVETPSVYHAHPVDGRPRLLETSSGLDPDGYHRAQAPAGTLELLCSVPGFLPALETLTLPVAGTARVEFRLERGLAVVLRLDDAARAALRTTDAHVFLVEEELWPDVRLVGTPFRVTLDPGRTLRSAVVPDRLLVFRDGRATLSGLAPGPFRLMLSGAAARLAPERIVLGPAEPGAAPVEIELGLAR